MTFEEWLDQSDLVEVTKVIDKPLLILCWQAAQAEQREIDAGIAGTVEIQIHDLAIDFQTAAKVGPECRKQIAAAIRNQKAKAVMDDV